MPRETKNDECDSCGFFCEVTQYDSGPPKRETYFACELCAGTMTSRYACDVTSLQPSNREVLQTICYVGNLILAKLAATK